MLTPEERLSYIIESIDRWLARDNHHLQKAITQTVDQGYFSFEDVRHSLRTLHEELTRDNLVKWGEKSGLFEAEGISENVLCLHPGNLPLAGFQDALATLLSGARYTGKISTKDPFLLPTFLNEVKKTKPWTDRDVQWVHQLDDLNRMLCDTVLFAGSERSAPRVKRKIRELNMEKPHTRYLTRTAHFSIAYLDEINENTLKHLTEGILRYGGQGCRSVAVVVSPYRLEDLTEDLEAQASNYWSKNPQHLSPGGFLEYRYAFNASVERPQLWLDDFLYQEGGFEFDYDFILYWKQGDELDAVNLAFDQWDEQVQSLYLPDNSDINLSGDEKNVEPLSSAQSPPIDWKPDGINTLSWLLSEK